MAPKSDSKTGSPQDPSFKPGSVVEISSHDEGFLGSWFLGTVIRRVSSKNPTVKYLVQYHTLFADDSGNKPLREALDSVQLRPVAPREKNIKFKFSESVDAYYNDGWWEGVITEDCGNGKFAVFFRSSKEHIVFGEDDLRLHREWINGVWKPPLQEYNDATANLEKEEITSQGKTGNTMTHERTANETTSSYEVKLRDVKKRKKSGTKKAPTRAGANVVDTVAKNKFSKGMLVEVSSDEDGFEGAWFAATIVEAVGKDKYLVQYQSLRMEDDTNFLREEIDILHIRPSPPETLVDDCFKLMEEVDALYNDAWWVGVVTKAHRDSRYTVYFKDTEEELVFKHSDLRPHQDFINEKWFMPSKVWSGYLKSIFFCDDFALVLHRMFQKLGNTLVYASLLHSLHDQT